MTNPVQLPSQEELLSVFEYNDGSLYWKIHRGGKAKKGTKAGNIDPVHGYVFIKYNERKYRAHRLIWKLLTGIEPTEVDHINRNRADNRIENLRLVSRCENTYNTGLRVNNTSGVKGVSWHKPTQKWIVYLNANKQRFYLGLFSCFTEASNVANSERLRLQGIAS